MELEKQLRNERGKKAGRAGIAAARRLHPDKVKGWASKAGKVGIRKMSRETMSRAGRLGGKVGNRAGKSEGARRWNHMNHHVNKVVFNPNCKYCQAEMT